MKIILILFAFSLSIRCLSQDLTGDKISRQADSSIVTIETYNSFNQKIGSGSGIILTTDGYIITNYHVYNGGSILKVSNRIFNKDFITSEIIFADSERDILLFKISGYGLKAIKLGDSDNAQKGESVYAIGSPFELENTFTSGVISGFRMEYPSDSAKEAYPYIQHDAALSPGNSGGALVNSKCELIGVNTMVKKDYRAQNINMAIPISEIKEILNFNSLGWVVKEEKKNTIGETIAAAYGYGAAKKKLDKYGRPPVLKTLNPYGKNNGFISVSTKLSNSSVDIWIDEEYLGRTSVYFLTPPICGQAGTLSKVVQANKFHKIRGQVINDTAKKWSAEIYIEEGKCQIVFMDAQND